jgi:hypothetical protein
LGDKALHQTLDHTLTRFYDFTMAVNYPLFTEEGENAMHLDHIKMFSNRTLVWPSLPWAATYVNCQNW